jgi:hypothetical protein
LYCEFSTNSLLRTLASLLLLGFVELETTCDELIASGVVPISRVEVLALLAWAADPDDVALETGAG